MMRTRGWLLFATLLMATTSHAAPPILEVSQPIVVEPGETWDGHGVRIVFEGNGPVFHLKTGSALRNVSIELYGPTPIGVVIDQHDVLVDNVTIMRPRVFSWCSEPGWPYSYCTGPGEGSRGLSQGAPAGVGILVVGSFRTTLRNIHVRDFQMGVRLTKGGPNDHSANGITISGIIRYNTIGIAADGLRDFLFAGLVNEANQTGFINTPHPDARVRGSIVGSHFENHPVNIILYGEPRLAVSGTSFSGGEPGIWLESGRYVSFTSADVRDLEYVRDPPDMGRSAGYTLKQVSGPP